MTAATAQGLRGNVIGWAGVAVGLLYAVLLGGGGLATQVGFARLFNVLVLAGAVGIWLAVAAVRPSWRPRSAVWPAIAAILATLVVTTITSWRPRFGLDFVGYAVLLTGGYLFLQRLMAHGYYESRLGLLTVVMGFIVCTWYLVAVMGHWLTFWSDVGRLTLPPLRPSFDGLAYGAPSAVGSVAFLLWLSAYAHLGIGTPRSRVVVGALGVLTAAVVFIAAARAAWVGVAVAAVLVGATWMLRPGGRRELGRWLGSQRAKATLGVAVVALIVVGILFLPAIASRFAEPGTDARFVFYAAAIRMFASSPIVGVGPGDWAIRRIAFTNPGETDYYIPHAHNIELQVVAEFGVVGIIAAIVVIASLAILVRRGLASDDATTRRLAWAVLAGTIYLVAYQQFDSYAAMVAVLLAFVLIVARLDARSTADVAAEPTAPRSWPVIATAGLALGTVIATGWCVWSERAAITYDTAAVAIRQGQWSEALASARDAVATDPSLPPYLFALGLAEAHAGSIPAARDAMASAASTDDYPVAWLDLARLDVDLGRNAEAVADLEAAMRLGRQQPQVAVGVAMLDLELGREPEAVDALADALVAAPSLASDPTLATGSMRAVLDQAIPVAFDRQEPADAVQMALELGQFDIATSNAARLPPLEAARTALMIRAWSGDFEAFDALRALATNNAVDPLVGGMCRRLELLAATENRGADWSCRRNVRPATYLVVRVVPSIQGRPVLPGPDASWHFQYTYRRLDPFDMLVPGLPHLQSTW